MSYIKIDLRDLTAEKLEEAKPHMKLCDYAAPCIIGSLVPPARRKWLAEMADPEGCGVQDNIGNLINQGFIILPAEQHEAAREMQNAFDLSYWDEVLEIADRFRKDIA
jgi:hypothetical protein